MRKVVQFRYGGPDELQVVDAETPAPRPTEVLVRVHAAGQNPVDWKTRVGSGVSGLIDHLPLTLGWEISGVVEGLGYGVTWLKPGDEVFGLIRFPAEGTALADYVTAPSRQLVRKPAVLTHVEAAAVPLAGLTAWQLLVDTAGIKVGQRVLVHGAAGGVGHFAVQIAKARGAYVIGTARAERHELVRSLGADEMFDYTSGRFEDHLRDLDVVVNMISPELGTRSISVIKPGGILVGEPGLIDEELELIAKEAGVRTGGVLVEPDQVGMRGLALLIENRQLRPYVSGTWPLEQVAELHRTGEQGQLAGKLVLQLV